MKHTTRMLGGVGVTRTICDRKKCQRPCPIVFRDREGREFCSERCKLAAEEENAYTEREDESVNNETGAATATKKAAKKAAKGTAKVATKKKAAKKGKAEGTGRKFGPDVKITLVKGVEVPEFRGYRAEEFKLIKSGMTVASFKEVVNKKKLPDPVGFLRFYLESGLISLS